MMDFNRENYDEDARILIKRLANNEIKMVGGDLSHVGVGFLVKTASEILERESVRDAIAKIPKEPCDCSGLCGCHRVTKQEDLFEIDCDCTRRGLSAY